MASKTFLNRDRETTERELYHLALEHLRDTWKRHSRDRHDQQAREDFETALDALHATAELARKQER
jgi:hypothetical protein